jgi:hypothetical protein
MMDCSFNYKDGNDFYKFIFTDRILTKIRWQIMKKNKTGEFEFIEQIEVDYRASKKDIIISALG